MGCPQTNGAVVNNSIKVTWTCADDPIVFGSKVIFNITSTDATITKVDIYKIQEGKPANPWLSSCKIPASIPFTVSGEEFGEYTFRAYKAGEDVSTSTIYGNSSPFEVKLAKPTTSNSAEVFAAEKILLLTPVTIAGTEIRYTLDGTTPSKTSAKYEGEFAHEKNAGDTFTLKAKTFVGDNSSALFEMAFTVASGDVLLQETFEDKTDLSDYTVVNNDLIQDTAEEWALEERYGNKLAECTVGDTNYRNDSRLELGAFDLSAYTSAKIFFDFSTSYEWALEKGDGGPHVIEGGVDLQLVVKEGSGEWKMLWHEADSLPNGVNYGNAIVALSDYVGTDHTDVKIAFWSIGEDAAWTTVDNIKVVGIK